MCWEHVRRGVGTCSWTIRSMTSPKVSWGWQETTFSRHSVLCLSASPTLTSRWLYVCWAARCWAGRRTALNQPSARLQPHRYLPLYTCKGPPGPQIPTHTDPPTLASLWHPQLPSIPPDTYNHIKAGVEAHDLSCRGWGAGEEGERKGRGSGQNQDAV